MNTTPKKPLVYVVPDIERALGREPIGDYFVITNKTPYAESVARKYPDNVWLVAGDEHLDTYGLLSRTDVSENITKHNIEVLVFKNTPRIERLATEKGWKLLNPEVELANTVEEKISQVAWLGELASYLPPHEVTTLEKVSFRGERFVLQFNHSHTGGGTYIIDSGETFSALRDKFPKRECRTVRYIEGHVFTVNALVSPDKILVGNVSFQITGLAPFTDTALSTIGNDWRLPYKILKKEDGAKIEEMARAIGARLGASHWRGLFGIDVIRETETGKIYLLEINARQPASTTLESQLQSKAGGGLTVFDAHIRALRGEKIEGELQRIRDGAQIVQRVTKKRNKASLHIDTERLTSSGFGVIRYENTEPNEDLVRITSDVGIMRSPTELDQHGAVITASLS